jgi:hypothetical protein
MVYVITARRFLENLLAQCANCWPMRESATMAKAELHERLTREDEVVVASDRSFGLTVGGVMLLVGIVKLWRGSIVGAWWLALAAMLLGLALLYPAALAPLNRLWRRLSLVLNRVVNPVVLAALFFVAVVPVALMMRTLGKDPLRLRRDPAAVSYWIARELSGPTTETMKQQF